MPSFAVDCRHSYALAKPATRFLATKVALLISCLYAAAAGKPPTATLTAKTPIEYGQSTNLTWSSTNAIYCIGTGFDTGAGSPTSGTATPPPPMFTTTYAVTCYNSSGGSATATAQVTVTGSPTALLSVKPTIINLGGSARLAWYAPNPSVCTGTGMGVDFLANPDQNCTNCKSVSPTTSTTYGVDCGGTTVARAIATVTADSVAYTFAPTAAANPSNFVTDCVADGADITVDLPLGLRSVFAGYGCNKVASPGTDPNNLFDGFAAFISPKVSTKRNETHSGLIVGPYTGNAPISTGANFTLETSTQTIKQLRSTPNAWEVAWVLWDYTDNTHFYYLILKPNGWELGKEDPVYAGYQRFLATGTTPKYPIGKRYVVTVKQEATGSATKLWVWVDGTELRNPATGAFPTFIDTERPYSGGLIGLYSEDAAVYFPSVVVTTPAN